MGIARLTLAALLLCAAACAAEEGADVRIRLFELERAEPPADDRGAIPQVGPRSALHFRWKIEGDVQRIALSANEKPLASFIGSIPERASDPCGTERCTTSHQGQIEYRLVAWDSAGRSDSSSFALRVAEQGLQILSFTSDPENIDPGATITLSWSTAGASEVRITSAPIGGGPTHELGLFEGDSARSGSTVDTGIAVSTLYRLEARDDEGQSVAAEITLPLRGDAWLLKLAADPPQAASGEPLTLSWESVGLDRLSILRDDGGDTIDDIRDEELDAGSRVVEIHRDTTFAFVGVSRDGEVVTERCDDSGCSSAQILVQIHPGPTVLAFAADQAEIPSGSQTTLRWSVTQADEVQISWVEATGSGTLPVRRSDRSVLVQPRDSARYSLVATGGGRSASRQLVLGVRPDIRIAAPGSAPPGGSFELSWISSGATLLELRVDGRRVPLDGAPVSSGSTNVAVAADAAPGSSLEVELIGSDDETPRRIGSARLQVRIE